jgi:hypothetical protein
MSLRASSGNTGRVAGQRVVNAVEGQPLFRRNGAKDEGMGRKDVFAAAVGALVGLLWALPILFILLLAFGQL